MKHIFTLLLIAGSINIALAQKSKSKPAPVITRFYQLTGTVDNQPVTFNLHRDGEQIYGSFYYDATEEPLEAYGTLQTDGSLRISVHDRLTGDMTEEYSGKFKDSTFTGTWMYKGKTQPFKLSIPRNTNGLSFDYVTTKGSKTLPKSQQFGRSEITYDAAAICPTASSTHPAAQSIRTKIFDAYNYSSTANTIGEAMLSEKKAVLNQGEEIAKYGATTNVHIEYWSNQILTFSTYNWEDNGGAHGNYTIKYTSIDLTTNQEVGPMFNDDCEQLPVVLDKKLREYFNVDKDRKLADFLLVDTLPINGNWLITTKGITCCYDPYEIAAYGAGQIRLYIPYKELEGCLNDEFKKLIGMNK